MSSWEHFLEEVLSRCHASRHTQTPCEIVLTFGCCDPTSGQSLSPSIHQRFPQKDDVFRGWVEKLPKGLYERLMKAALEATAHVEEEMGPVVFQVKIYRRDKLQPLQAQVELVSKRWQAKD